MRRRPEGLPQVRDEQLCLGGVRTALQPDRMNRNRLGLRRRKAAREQADQTPRLNQVAHEPAREVHHAEPCHRSLKQCLGVVAPQPPADR